MQSFPSGAKTAGSPLLVSYCVRGPSSHTKTRIRLVQLFLSYTVRILLRIHPTVPECYLQTCLCGTGRNNNIIHCHILGRSSSLFSLSRTSEFNIVADQEQKLFLGGSLHPEIPPHPPPPSPVYLLNRSACVAVGLGNTKNRGKGKGVTFARRLCVDTCAEWT